LVIGPIQALRPDDLVGRYAHRAAESPAARAVARPPQPRSPRRQFGLWLVVLGRDSPRGVWPRASPG
jgi:hypothetical protein